MDPRESRRRAPRSSGAPRPGRSGPAGHAEDAVAAALRVPAFAGLSVALGVTGHLLAGGALPDPPTVLALTIGVAVLWRFAARDEQSLPHLSAGVWAVQLLVHLALPACADHPSSSPSMVAAHGAAGLALAWWLRRGEAAFWAAVRRAMPRLHRPYPGPRVHPGPRRTAPLPPASLHDLVAARTDDRHRGPPRPALAA